MIKQLQNETRLSINHIQKTSQSTVTISLSRAVFRTDLHIGDPCNRKSTVKLSEPTLRGSSIPSAAEKTRLPLGRPMLGRCSQQPAATFLLRFLAWWVRIGRSPQFIFSHLVGKMSAPWLCEWASCTVFVCIYVYVFVSDILTWDESHLFSGCKSFHGCW